MGANRAYRANRCASGGANGTHGAIAANNRRQWGANRATGPTARLLPLLLLFMLLLLLPLLLLLSAMSV